jgi:hypothetical protein
MYKHSLPLTEAYLCGMLRLPAHFMFMLVGFVSLLECEMGPKLKRKMKRQGVLLLFGVEKERAGSLPRFVEKFTSRLEINGKGWFSPSFVGQETSPFLQSIFAFARTAHRRYYIYPFFLVRYPSS